MRDEITQKNVDPTTCVGRSWQRQRFEIGYSVQILRVIGRCTRSERLGQDQEKFDDIRRLAIRKQNTCEKYYIRGRHSNVDCFYLAQNYFRLPRQTIRENANFICLFPQDLKNINHIYNDHVSSDMPKEEFRSLCKRAWSQPHGFVTIDLTSDKRNGKYRVGFDLFYIMN
jgi:hypothetical protein